MKEKYKASGISLCVPFSQLNIHREDLISLVVITVWSATRGTRKPLVNASRRLVAEAGRERAFDLSRDDVVHSWESEPATCEHFAVIIL